jgi:hypothetical protein
MFFAVCMFLEMAYILFLAFKCGALNFGAHVMLGTAAVLLYLGLRIIFASFAITEDAAEIHPVYVHDAVVSIENLITAGVAATVFYGTIAYITYCATPSSNSPVVVGNNTDGTGKIPTIPGGFINFANLRSMRARAIGAYSDATPPDAPA